MPTITSIKPQKNQKRVNIYLDGKFSSKGRPTSDWGFGLDLENFVKLGLKVGQEYTEEEIEEIIKKAEFQKVYDKILRFASLRPRSEKEYRFWLKKHKVHKSLHQELFNRLKRLDFLDDKKFAIWWIEQRQTFRPKSVRVLGLELRSKGIDKETTEEVLAESGVDETVMIKKLIRKKEYMWKKLSGFEKRVKMSNFLARNGYSWDTIRKVVGEFDEE